ncbi:hypothetical protein SSX86_016308 [Deinandra increscens subsp. villosa]|uniref:Uncharacterized protein n=1 Tax=Deinandra increscens subsp. villosa TaxID=3103831 RepID=A0AAP0D2F9_9ASTR
MAAAVFAESDETKVASVSNTKVLPATIDPPRVPNSNSLRDYCSETFELGFKDGGIGIGGEKKEVKKPKKWRWKIWVYIYRRNNKDGDEDQDRCSTVSGVGRSYSESWQDIRDCNNGGNNSNRKVFRSNSSVSCRSSALRRSNQNNMMNGKVNANRNDQGFVNGLNGTNQRVGDEFVLERNRSARY